MSSEQFWLSLFIALLGSVVDSDMLIHKTEVFSKSSTLEIDYKTDFFEVPVSVGMKDSDHDLVMRDVSILR